MRENLPAGGVSLKGYLDHLKAALSTGDNCACIFARRYNRVMAAAGGRINAIHLSFCINKCTTTADQIGIRLSANIDFFNFPTVSCTPYGYPLPHRSSTPYGLWLPVVVIMLALVTLLLVGRAQATCRALSLEGGGDKGAFQVGAFVAFVQNLPPEEVAYDFVTGVSAGALNSCIMSQYPQGQEAAAGQALNSTWLNAPVSTLLKQWPGGYIQGLFENSLFDGSGMLSWVESIVKQPPLRNITVGSTNEDLGIFQDFNQTIGYDDFVVACLASSAFPVFLPNRQLFNHTMMDGGCIINIDVFTAVEQCLSITGGDQSQVIVDSILLSGSYIPHENAGNFSTWEVVDRVHGIKSADSYIWYIYNAMQAYPDVNFRYTVLPTSTLPGGLIPLNFDQKDMLAMMAQGVIDAEKVLAGNGGTLDTVQLYMNKRTARTPFSRSR